MPLGYGCTDALNDDGSDATFYGVFLSTDGSTDEPKDSATILAEMANRILGDVECTVTEAEETSTCYSHRLQTETKETYRLTIGRAYGALSIKTEQEEKAVFKTYRDVTYQFVGGIYPYETGEIRVEMNAIYVNDNRYLQLDNYTLALSIPTGEEEERIIHPEPETYSETLSCQGKQGIYFLTGKERAYEATAGGGTCLLVQTEPEYKEIGNLDAQ